MKTCKIIPVYRKPVRNILPYGKTISVPTQMPLDDAQLLKASMQATLYEVIPGRGDVLLTKYNRSSDNSNAPIVLGVPDIIDYYDNNGNRIMKDTAEVVKEEAAPIVEAPVVEEKKEEAPVAQKQQNNANRKNNKK